jgi:hypothetical protein
LIEAVECVGHRWLAAIACQLALRMAHS